MTAKKLNKFDDPEFLSALADKAMCSNDEERRELLSRFLPTLNPEQRILFNKLDDIAVHEVVDVQSRTVRALKDALLTASAGAC